MPDRLGNALAFASKLSATYGELPARKPGRRIAKVSARNRPLALELKRERAQAGCEVCGWTLGPELWQVLHAHHVVPLSCGGADIRENMVVLCPNHHAQTHRIGKRDYWRWTGPRTRQELLETLGVVPAGQPGSEAPSPREGGMEPSPDWPMPVFRMGQYRRMQSVSMEARRTAAHEWTAIRERCRQFWQREGPWRDHAWKQS